MTRDPRALWGWADDPSNRLAALLPQLEAADALIKSILFVVDNNPRLVGRAGLVKAADTFLAARDAHRLTAYYAARDAHLTEGAPDD